MTGGASLTGRMRHVSETKAGPAELAPAQVRALIVETFDHTADEYDQLGIDFFGTFGQWLVDAAKLGPGDRVVDLGSGRGAATFPAATAVGPEGSVLAIDLAPRMVELLRADAAARGMVHVEVRLGDVQDADLDGPFDCVLAAFVLFFMTDPAGALRRYHRLLRPDGRIAISTFFGDDKRWSWLRELREMIPAEARPPDPAGRDPFRSADALHALLAGNGFTDSRSIEREHRTSFRDADHWVRWSYSNGHRAVWDRMPAERAAEGRELARARIDEMVRRHGTIELRTGVRLTTAKRSPKPPQWRSSSAT